MLNNHFVGNDSGKLVIVKKIMENIMKKTRHVILRFNIAIIMIHCLLCTLMLPAISEAKKADPNEEVWDDGEHAEVRRKKFGLVARDVTTVKIGNCYTFWDLFISQKGEQGIKVVDFYHKTYGKKLNYKTKIVSKERKNFFPMQQRVLSIDKKNRLLVTGWDLCHLFEEHHNEKECLYSFDHPVVNKLVMGKMNPKRCWYDDGMFAYVKKNTLYVTGEVMMPDGDTECYEYPKVQSFFEGKGNQIKKVVSGEREDLGPATLFVLMKDGSLWGWGYNGRKLISSSKQKHYDDFVEIFSSGVKDVAASTNNAAIIKKNDTLWVWGRTMKSNKKEFSATPKKIAANVKEVSLSFSYSFGNKIKTRLVYLNKSGKAYGMGQNQRCVFTSRYKTGWHKKPVLLMENVKHVYSVSDATLLLTKNNDLYWTGVQDYKSVNWWRIKGL